MELLDENLLWVGFNDFPIILHPQEIKLLTLSPT